MNVAIDARKLHDGGIGTYIRGLVGGLASAFPADHWTAIVDPAQTGRTPWPGAVQECPVSAGKYGLAEHVRVPQAARDAGAQLLHAPHYTLPLGWSGPSVVTIHDLIHIRFAHFHRPGAGLYARAMAGLAASRASVVIADSEATKRDVVELLGTPASKVQVVPLGVSPRLAPASPAALSAFLAARSLPAGYVLYVGARKRHKNLELLLRAWAAMSDGSRPALVLSGMPWDGREPLARLARTLGLEHHILFSGALADEAALSCLYSGASLLVQPSLIEGFGLPPLEALACGVAVLSSDAGSLPEVLGEHAAYLPPRDPEAWAHEIERLLSDDRRRHGLAARGRTHAATFTWERTARMTHGLYESALGAPAR